MLRATFKEANEGRISNEDALNVALSAALSASQTLVVSAIANALMNGTIPSSEHATRVLNKFLSHVGDMVVESLNDTAEALNARSEAKDQQSN